MGIQIKFVFVSALLTIGVVLSFPASAAETSLQSSDDEFSLTPPEPCIVPPRAPPDSLLKKKFKVYSLTFDVHRLDVNGDGICDWLREGFVENVRDLESRDVIRLDKFLFLGTAKGWRPLKSLPANKKILLEGTKVTLSAVRDGMSPFAAALYQKGRRAPLLVAYAPPERTNSGDLLYADIVTWNVEYEFLESIDRETRTRAFDFLARKLCRDRPDYDLAVRHSEWSYAVFMVKPHNGGMCPVK